MNKAFTLLEVLISVVLVFMIGEALTKISSQNINVMESVKKNMTCFDSVMLNSTNDYRDLNSYLSIKDIPLYDALVEKKTPQIVKNRNIIIDKDFIINYTINKESLKINNETKSYFRIK